VLKKLRVALSLNSFDVVEILSFANFEVTESELNDLFRAEDHPKFKKCGDQMLRKFLDGLIVKYRDKNHKAGEIRYRPQQNRPFERNEETPEIEKKKSFHPRVHNKTKRILTTRKVNQTKPNNKSGFKPKSDNKEDSQ